MNANRAGQENELESEELEASIKAEYCNFFRISASKPVYADMTDIA